MAIPSHGTVAEQGPATRIRHAGWASGHESTLGLVAAARTCLRGRVHPDRFTLFRAGLAARPSPEDKRRAGRGIE